MTHLYDYTPGMVVTKAQKKELYSIMNKALFKCLILFTREYLFGIFSSR